VVSRLSMREPVTIATLTIAMVMCGTNRILTTSPSAVPFSGTERPEPSDEPGPGP
jgi:hypothetical protein